MVMLYILEHSSGCLVETHILGIYTKSCGYMDAVNGYLTSVLQGIHSAHPRFPLIREKFYVQTGGCQCGLGHVLMLSIEVLVGGPTLYQLLFRQLLMQYICLVEHKST